MRRAIEILAEENSVRTIVGVTSAFESLSSMKIMLTKRDVLSSDSFFHDVWAIYKNIRVSAMFQFGRRAGDHAIDKELFILITAPAGLSGDIDSRLIQLMRQDYDPAKNDIVVIGRHGAQMLTQLGISYKKFFNLPRKDDVNVDPLLNIVRQYRETRIFYQSYVSLMNQEVKSLVLSEDIEKRGESGDNENNEIISETTYIFEPNPAVVVAHMELSMTRMALIQTILNSRLAQYASRFKAMSMARQRSTEKVAELHTQYNRAKRGIVDQRLKEITAHLKKVRTVR